MPEVSVIIPIYNTAAYLRKALDSICGQTLKELEIILIDDGSTDGSRGIIEEYAKRDARIRWYAQPNQGLSVARNRGLLHATGKYIYLWTVTTYWIRKPSGAAIICARKENWTSSSSMQNR